MLQLEYFALLFLIVYVGAIVVLFLFIVMMLEVRTFNVAQRFQDLFSHRS
jgi:NADH:ubiquinone oxidoreductase subunit 6 (subunit J)